MKYKNTSMTMDEYIKSRKKEIADIHGKAKEILNISHSTWIKKRKTGNFRTEEILMLSEKLFKVNTVLIFNLCKNTNRHYYKLSN